MTLSENLSYMTWVIGRSITVFLPAWLIRRGRELDMKHSQIGTLVRWLFCFACLVIVTFVGGAQLAALRIVVGIAGLVILRWPNFVWRFFPRNSLSGHSEGLQ